MAPVCALACINDRDTLAFEVRNVDAVRRVTEEKDTRKRHRAIDEIALRAIGGRFERYPDQYYLMRIDRLKAKPSLSAAEHDDLAVAHDRIGKIDDAIRIIEASRSLRKSDADWYRLHANYGTFLVHKWVAERHGLKRPALLDQSIAEIEKALKINPTSHFGREMVQLELEKSWRANRTTTGLQDLVRDDKSIVGLAGIAMMGLGYEMPDLYDLMCSVALSSHRTISSLSMARAEELVAKGGVPVAPKLMSFVSLTRRRSDDRPEYRQLRFDGESVHKSRMAYMEKRFARGEHPDTHANFWESWKEPPYPVLVYKGNNDRRTSIAIVGASAVITTLFLTGLGVVWWRQRRLRRESLTP